MGEARVVWWIVWVMIVVWSAGGIARPLRAQGGPPLETDDPGTPGEGRVELNIALEAERERDGTGYDAPRVDFNYGAGARVQLKAEVPWRIAAAPSQPTRTGFGNVILGVKWRFVEWDSGRVAVSMYPQVTLAGSRGTVANGLADSGYAVLLPVEVAWPLGPVDLDAELGYRQAHGGSELMYGLVVAHQALPSLELLGECNGAGGIDFTGVGLLCGIGVQWELRPLLGVLGALEKGVAGAPDSRPALRVYTGAQLRW
jgi:hypothetical protein